LLTLAILDIPLDFLLPWGLIVPSDGYFRNEQCTKLDIYAFITIAWLDFQLFTRINQIWFFFLLPTLIDNCMSMLPYQIVSFTIVNVTRSNCIIYYCQCYQIKLYHLLLVFICCSNLSFFNNYLNKKMLLKANFIFLYFYMSVDDALLNGA
jgi:hypothetical protein